MRYFDVLYGQVDLDEIVAEILDRHWELRRLKHVGMMNFRSLSMHPLTHCSRLEHAIGTAYLAQRFATANGLDRRRRRTIVAAALLHDISCAPFGHSVEWALRASGRVDSHEVASLWTVKPKMAAATSGRPLFLDSLPFDANAFGLDLKYFEKLRTGSVGHTHIKSDHMDLDNIDSVFRMAHYLGIEFATRDHVFALVDNLRTLPTEDHFAIIHSALPQATLWHDLRHEVYKAFIYDPEYLSFEMQVFELVDRLTEIVGDPRELAGVADFPDDVLLWQYFIDDTFADLRPLLRRLIALQPYGCVLIARFEDRSLCEALPSRELITKLREAFSHTLLGSVNSADESELPDGPLKRWIRALSRNILDYRGPFHIHLTTDKRKTGRRILFSVIGADDTTKPLSQGQDRFYVVATLMSEVGVSKREATILQTNFRAALSSMTEAEVEAVYGGDDAVKPQLSLEL
jgi:HD superfamily phosphohydrolase